MKPDPTAGEHQTVDLQTDRPHPARVYDYLLGGRDNFPPDREAAERSLSRFPHANTPPRQNRGFLRRAVGFLAAEAGIRQFLDIGTGLPTSPNVHQVAQASVPEARIVYVDNDPIVLSHARALLTSTAEGRTAYIDADVRDPDKIVEQAKAVLDFSQPIGLLLLSIIHFVRDDEDPYGLVRRYVDQLAPGSYVALSHLTGEFDRPTWAYIASQFEGTSHTMTVRDQATAEGFFEGMQMVEPGVTLVHRWRPDPDDNPDSFQDSQVSCWCGVARKP
jgi:hypothetical protein